MSSHKVLRGVTRLLCALIDYLILMLPVQFVLLFWIKTNALSADFLFRLLIAVYGVLMIEYNNGATLDKMIGRLKVVDRAGGKPTVLYTGLRELIRAMYLIPIVGWAAGLVSTVMLFVKGTTLHDMAENSRVIFRWEDKPDPEQEKKA